ncbi:hypothetical protein AB0N16_18665 [Streptomyces sp. NPDC051105]|uniref:hypothetical protein n=1 Tax=Streptomyces sp. NPDC051105 TaxID=3154843 RepID=UPI003426FA60
MAVFSLSVVWCPAQAGAVRSVSAAADMCRLSQLTVNHGCVDQFVTEATTPDGCLIRETFAPETPAAPVHPNATGESAMATAVEGVLAGHSRPH